MAGILTWLTLILTGQPVVKIPYLISGIILLGCQLVLWLSKENHEDFPKIKLGYLRLVYLSILFAIPILLGFYSNSWTLTRLTVVSLCLLSVLSMTQYSTNFVVNTFTSAVVVVVASSYLSLIFQFDVRKIGSGYSFNFLDYRFSGILGHPAYLGLLCALTLILNFSTKLTFGIKLLLILTLFISEHRVGLIALLVCFIILIFYDIAKNGKFSNRNLISFILVVLCTTYLSINYFFRSRSGSTEITTGRNLIWDLCLEEARQSPVFGFGINYLSNNYGEDPNSSIRAFTCHNQFLENVLNYGIPYGIVFSFFFIFLLITTYKDNLRTDFIALIAIFIVGLTEAPIQLAGRITHTVPLVLISSIILSRKPISDLQRRKVSTGNSFLK